MEERNEDMAPEEGYVPRPVWQVWAARIGVVVMLMLVIVQVLQILGGFQL